jgi:Tol biopolymer transport system component
MRSSHLIAVAAVTAAIVLPAQAGAAPAGTIAFHQKTFTDDNSQIYVARADGTSGAVALTTPTSAPDPAACWGGICAAEFPAWSPDGSRVYFGSSWTPFFHVWSAAPDGSDPVMEPPNTDFEGAPAISKDGSLIAWDGGNEDGSGVGIYLRALGSATATRLTTGPSHGFDSSPDFSPDGTRVVFTRLYESGIRVEIWIVNTDGTGLRRLLSGGRRWGDPHFSPDGSRILVQAYDERANQGRNSNEFTIRPDGSGLTPLTNEPMGSFSFSGDWSPDGKHIAYVHVQRGDDSLQIRSMDASGNDESLIVDCDPDIFCDNPSWGPYEGPLPSSVARAAVRARTAHVSRVGASRRAAAKRLRRAVIRRLTSR